MLTNGSKKITLFEAEGISQRGRAKKTWSFLVGSNTRECELRAEDAQGRNKTRTLSRGPIGQAAKHVIVRHFNRSFFKQTDHYRI